MDRGILRVSNEVLPNFMVCIPAEHRVLAYRTMPEMTEFLIEGPHMPHTRRKATPIVELILSSTEYGELFAHWTHLPDVEWPVSLATN